MNLNNIKHIIISRTDSIGDVILTIPLCGILKKEFPHLKITFIGKTYTQSIIKKSSNIDHFCNYDDIKRMSLCQATGYIKDLNADAIVHVFPNKKLALISKKARIKYRVGTRNRFYHLLTCNIRPSLSRKKSDLHEAQLNIKLLEKFINIENINLSNIPDYYGLKLNYLNNKFNNTIILNNKFNLILHPGSKGSAREWGINNYAKLIQLIDKEKFNIYISGTSNERKSFKKDLIEPFNDFVIDICDKFNLNDFIDFISQCDGLLACSTGPLHIAAATGINALGIYSPMRPIHPGRWKPIGNNTHVFVKNKSCNNCRDTKQCECIQSITPEEIIQKLNTLKKISVK